MTSFFLRLLAPAASAAPPCGQPGGARLPGCGNDPFNILGEVVIPNLAILGLRIAAILALIFVIIAGLGLIIAKDDGARATAKKGIAYAMGGLALALLSGVIVAFVVNNEFGQNMPVTTFLFGGLLGGTIKILLNITNVALTLMIIWQGVLMLTSQGKSDQFNSARTALFWTVVGALVVNISRLLVNIVLTLNI